MPGASNEDNDTMHTPYLHADDLQTLAAVIRTARAMQHPVTVILPYEHLAQAEREAKGCSSINFWVE